MPDAEVVELQPKPAEPATNSDWWARIGELKRRQATALAERAQLTARLGTLTLAATGKDDAAEAELTQVRARLVELQNVEQEVAAAIAVAEARRKALVPAQAVARRQGSRQRCAELADDRRQIAAELDRLLSELNDMLRGYLAAGQMQTGALRGGGARVEAGPSDPIDAIRVCDAIVRMAPALVRMLRERGFAPSVIPADARPMVVHENLQQHRVEAALEQAARHDLRELEEAA
jgi:hypothetical protein